MVARIASARVAPKRIDELLGLYRDTLRPAHRDAYGLLYHYWLVDRGSGEVRLVGLWDSQESIDAATPTLEPARERFWSVVGARVNLEVYEVADEI